MKICKDCKHYYLTCCAVCCAPEAEVYKDVVYGYWPKCRDMRIYYCGPDANWYTEKDNCKPSPPSNKITRDGGKKSELL